jgi:hypothetical protein
MDTKNETLQRTVNEKSNSKSCDSSKVILNSVIQLSKGQIISDSFCYVCAETNPQFSELLFDKRSVNYCGICFVIILHAKEMYC